MIGEQVHQHSPVVAERPIDTAFAPQEGLVAVCNGVDATVELDAATESWQEAVIELALDEVLYQVGDQ